MYGIAFFGILMIFLSSMMVVNPDNWSNRILKFTELKYFHGFEIVSRLLLGAVFIIFSDQTLYPTVMRVIGYLMTAVGVGLLIAGPSRHKQFAVWSAKKFYRTFRPAGIVSLVFGVFIAYAALKGP